MGSASNVGGVVRKRHARSLWRLSLVLALINSVSALGAKDRLSRDSRIEVIRGLMKEVAVTKVELPRGKHGVYVSSDGKLDQARAATQLRTNGPAIRPGMPVEITKIDFKGKRIVFELNGGGRRGKRWYQRIEIGMGTSTNPIAPETPVLAYGSSISLLFPGEIPELTVPQVKAMLAEVLDFERRSPTSLYSPTVPPEIKEAIKNHQVIVGMDRDAVLSAKGPPDRRVREVREGVEREDWMYGLPPHVLFVTFDGDTVIAIQQH